MKISWLILTYNRANSVAKAIPHCMKEAGHHWHEIIWVDNGSEITEFGKIQKAIYQSEAPVTLVMNRKNEGVAAGYNNAMALARGTHLVITGCDMMMPKNWLLAMVRAFENVERTGIVTIYAAPIEKTPERIRGPEIVRNGIVTRDAMPMGRRMFTRALLDKAGYLREDFGLYGWEDIEWAHRVERVCKSENLLCYNLPQYVAEHLGTEGNVGYDHKDEHEYWRWKKEQVNDPAKQKLLSWCGAREYPYYSPFPDSKIQIRPDF